VFSQLELQIRHNKQLLVYVETQLTNVPFNVHHFDI